MIEPTDEMRRAYAETWLRAVTSGLDDAVIERMVGEEVAKPLPHREAALAALLAVVERDVLQPALEAAYGRGRDDEASAL
jgi:hypothetical protein